MAKQIKLYLGLAYVSGPYIEKEAVVTTVDEVDDIIGTITNNINYAGNQSYLLLTPYNEDPNSNILATDLFISLDGLRSMTISTEVIESTQPLQKG